MNCAPASPMANSARRTTADRRGVCERYGVSRFTVREALRRLQAEGLIRRRRGSGTTIDTGVRAQRQPISDIADLSHYAAGSRFDFAVTGPVTLAALAAAELGLEPGSRWIHLAGKRRLDVSDPAVALTDVYVHADLAAHVAGLLPGNQIAVFATGRRRGVSHRPGRPGSARQRRRQPRGDRARYSAACAGLAHRAPVSRYDGRVVEASISVHPGDRFTYSMQIDPG